MFVGEFPQKIDAKNRLVIPSKFRALFPEGEDRKGLFIFASPVPGEHCLRLYTMSEWRKVVEHWRVLASKAKDPARYMRFFTKRGEFAPIDSASRVVVPQKLLDYAGLKREVLIVGNAQWIEVWNTGDYEAATESLDEEIGDRSRAMWPGAE